MYTLICKEDVLSYLGKNAIDETLAKRRKVATGIYKAMQIIENEKGRQIVFCKECEWKGACKITEILGDDGFCSSGEPKQDRVVKYAYE
jgi:hypothetical protein